VKRKTKKYLSTLLASAMVFSSMVSNVSLVSAATEENIISDSTDVNTSGGSVISNTADNTDSAKVTNDEKEQDEVKVAAVDDVQLAAGDGKLEVTSSAAVEVEEEGLKTGDEFTVRFDVTNNPGINNATFFVKYNPKVVRAIDGFTIDELGTPNVGVYNEDEGTREMVISYADIVKQLSLRPNKDDNEDYAAISAADGTVSASALGLIKLAGKIDASDGNNVLLESTDNGGLFGLKFQAVGVGDSEIGIVEVPSSETMISSSSNIFKGNNDVKRNFSEIGKTSVSVERGNAEMVASVVSEDKEFITVNYDVKLNPGFNNATFFVDFDPNILEAVEDGMSKNIGINGKEFIPSARVRDQISYTPTVSNPDYANLSNLPDGVKVDGKTPAGKLGRIKLASYIEENDGEDKLLEVTETGTLFSIKFKKKAAGETTIELKQIPDGKGFVDANNQPLNMVIEPLKVSVKTEEQPTEPTTEEAKLVGEVAGESEDGKTVYVDYKITNNPGFDNVKFSVKYKKEIVLAVDDNSKKAVIGFNGKELIPASLVNEQINKEVSNTGLTAAGAGNIEIKASANGNVTDDGILFRIAFKRTSIKDTSALIEIADAEFKSGDKKQNVTIENASIKINPVSLLGDADGNNRLDANDAAVVFEHTLNKDFILNVEDRVVDVDGKPYEIDSNDAANILTKVLNNDHVFPALDRDF